jgi:hypothetical protein
VAHEARRFYVLLQRIGEWQFLVRVERGTSSLPHVTVPEDADILDAKLVNDAVKAQLGLDVHMLHSMHCYRRPEPHMNVCTLENSEATWQPHGALRWAEQSELETCINLSEFEWSILSTWIAELQTDRPLLPWWQPGWAERAATWLVDSANSIGLTLTGPPEQIKSWYLSSVWRVPTSEGDLYFKAVPPYASVEVALASLWRDSGIVGLPDFVGVHSGRAWLLTRDMQGRPLEKLRDVDVWAVALRDYARFQQSSGASITEYLAVGCTDMRLTELPRLAASLFGRFRGLLTGLPERHWEFEPGSHEALLPAIDNCCREALAIGIPPTLVHGDFHGMNIVRSVGETLFFDWSGANVSHPFFDVQELLSADDWLPAGEGAYETLRDNYLGEWLAYTTLDRLRVLYETLRSLWNLTQALGYERTLVGMESVVPLGDRLQHSCAEWATQQQQYGLAVQLRRLIESLK